MAPAPVEQIIYVASIFLFLTWISTLLRVYVRASISKLFGLEDWFMIAAQCCFTLTGAFAIQGILQSKGMHLVDIPAHRLFAAMRWWFCTELAYAATTCMLKLSVALFLLRIAKERSHRMLIHATMVIIVSVSLGYFIFLLFQCSPVDFFWSRFIGEKGTCLHANVVGALTYVQSGVSAGADVVLAVLPVVIVSRLQMNIRTKLTVISILSMGLIACAAVIIRIPYVKILVVEDDLTFSSVNVVIWSNIEPGLAITAANMATLRPLFQKFFSRSKLWGTSSARAKSNNGHSKPIFGFQSRRGYMRNESNGNTEELGLRALDKNGVTTTVQASEEDLEDLDLRGETPLEGKGDGKWLTKVQWQNGDREKDRPKSQWPIGISVRQSVKTEVAEKQEQEPKAPHAADVDLEDGRATSSSKSFDLKRERGW